MATEKRLIDHLREMADRTPPICQYDKPEKTMIFGKEITVYCKPFEQFQELLRRAADALDVDAVEVADMREFAEDVVYQFGYYCQNGGRLHITHGGLSTLEHAFDILGWKNPHPVPECECQIEGCYEHATCGTHTADGYKRVCGKHMAKMGGDGNG